MSFTWRWTWPTVVPASAWRTGSASSTSAAAVEVERVRAAERLELRPDVARPVGRELDAVAVRVGQVDRLGDPVVGGAFDRRARDGQALEGAGQRLAAPRQQRHVVEPGVAAGAARGLLLDEHDEVLAAGAHRGDRVLAAVQPQPDRV